jgi:hypothetical protein
LKTSFLVTLIYGVLVSHAAYAQATPIAADDPVAEARFHFGVVGANPRIALRSIGFDTNVFNSSTNKQRDLTATVSPGSTFYLRTGKGLLTVDGNLDLVHFNKFDSERSVNSAITGRYELRFNRIRPYVSARSINTRERPGFEIDARARHYESDFHVGTDLRVASKSTVRVDLRQLEYRFDGDEVFNGRPLNQELNRTLKVIDLGWRQRLTALTTWVTRISRETERFEFSSIRNSDSFRINSGFELGRFALIRGSAFAGYRKLRPADGGVLPEFSGATADVNVSYTAPSQTRLGLAVDRDVQYSYEFFTPYYVQTGWTASLTQRVVGRWDAQLTGGRDRLSYQSVATQIERTDHVGRWGAGIGYSLGDQVRASFDVQSFYRSSDQPGREYGGLRAGMSVTYGY